MIITPIYQSLRGTLTTSWPLPSACRLQSLDGQWRTMEEPGWVAVGQDWGLVSGWKVDLLVLPLTHRLQVILSFFRKRRWGLHCTASWETDPLLWEAPEKELQQGLQCLQQPSALTAGMWTENISFNAQTPSTGRTCHLSTPQLLPGLQETVHAPPCEMSGARTWAGSSQAAGPVQRQREGKREREGWRKSQREGRRKGQEEGSSPGSLHLLPQV